MGSAASSLSPEQSAELTRLMKLEYEQNAGKSDEEIRQILVPKYNAHLTKVLQTVTPLGNGQRSNSKSNLKEKAPTRRRSFGEDPNKKLALNVSQSSPIIAAIIEANAATTAAAAPVETHAGT